MSAINLTVTAFNPRRSVNLVGIITDVSDYLAHLYAKIGNNREFGTLQKGEGYANSRLFEPCYACAAESRGDIDPSRMIAPELSLKQGAVLLWSGTVCGPVAAIKQLANEIGIDYGKPLSEQDPRFIDILLYGYKKEPIAYVYKSKHKEGFYRGCVHDLRYMRDKGTKSKGNLRAIDFFSRPVHCPACGGSRLGAELLAVMIQGRTAAEATRLSIIELLDFIRLLPASVTEQELYGCGQLIEELRSRLLYLNRIGLRALSSTPLLV